MAGLARALNISPRILRRRVRPVFRRIIGRLVAGGIWGVLFALRPVVPVSFLVLSEYRIGGYAAHTDFYLRQARARQGSHPRGLKIAIIGQPCSEQLTRMFKRHIPLFKNRAWNKLINVDVGPGQTGAKTLKSSRFVHRPLLPVTKEDLQLAEASPVLRFTAAEERRGQRLLKEMGIPEGSWFVCFHARDLAYFRVTTPQRDFSNTSFRNCSIANYVDAMKYVASCGGYALRLGAFTEDPMPEHGEPRIIDYAREFRSDFGDIYLPAKCKFFVGSNDGLTTVPMMFNVPVVDANSLIMPTRAPGNGAYAIPLGSRDIFIPKPIVINETGQALTFRELLTGSVHHFSDRHEYEEAGLRVLENSPEEILGATREMNERLDGNLTYSEEDTELQSRFRSYIDQKPENQKPGNFDTFARVGADYLRAHRDLLD